MMLSYQLSAVSITFLRHCESRARVAWQSPYTLSALFVNARDTRLLRDARNDGEGRGSARWTTDDRSLRSLGRPLRLDDRSAMSDEQ